MILIVPSDKIGKGYQFILQVRSKYFSIIASRTIIQGEVQEMVNSIICILYRILYLDKEKISDFKNK